MRQIFKVMESVENTNSTNEKMELLKSGILNNKNFYEFLYISCCDAILNIADKKIKNSLDIKNVPNTHSADIGKMVEWTLKDKKESDISFHIFELTFNNLMNVSGKNSEFILKEFFDKCDSLSGKWFARAFTKNLHFGLSIISLNKIFKELNLKSIPVFELSLCGKINCDDMKSMKEDIQKVLDENTFLFAEPKYDGVRALIKKFNGEISAISRNGKPLKNVQPILDALDKRFPDTNIILDGEIIGENFQDLMKNINRIHDIKDTEYKFMIFDILHYNGGSLIESSQNDRSTLLKNIFKDSKDVFQITESIKFTEVNEIIEYFNKCVKNGMEGIILKNNSIYQSGRKNWYKMKPVKTADLLIFDILKGSGKNSNRNAIICLKDKTGTVISNVGSGISEDDIKILNNKDISLIGSIAEVQYDCITEPNEDSIRSLRFPRFICFRNDKNEADEL